MNPMETSTQAASSSVHSSNRGVSGSRKTEDLMYQAVTIAAVLLLLGSLWVF
jgi:preprotein translocase subunit SecG